MLIYSNMFAILFGCVAALGVADEPVKKNVVALPDRAFSFVCELGDP